MLDINLNLLNKSTKAEIAATIKYIKIANRIILFFIIISITTLILFIGQQYLTRKNEQLNKITVPIKQKTEITKINENINQLIQIQKDYIKWSRVLKNFFELTPPGIKLQTVQFDRENGIIQINGFAKTRKAFLEYKDKLKDSDMTGKINSPIANLLHRKNFNFNLSAELKL